MFHLNDTDALRDHVYNTAVSGGDSVIVLNAVTDNYHVIDWMKWSYLGTPAAGALTIVDNTNSNTVLSSADITVAGPGEFSFAGGFKCPKSSKVSVILVDGNTTKKLTIGYR